MLYFNLNSSIKNKKWWRIYAWINILFGIVSLLDPPVKEEVLSLIVWTVPYLILLMALFGYSYDKTFFNHIFWKISKFYVLFIVVFVMYGLTFNLENILAIVWLIPLIYVLFEYEKSFSRTQEII